ncbi:MAG: HAMP domain-containing protein [Bryobacterales bacterium]|nr:HAMP domain-containing protein [Bryobacterales bacterium]
MPPAFSRLSLLWKIVLSTSVAITLLFAVTGMIVQKHTVDTTARSLEEEVKASFQAYESLWRSRAEMLASVSRVLAGMSDVRAAFGTGDDATIRDTAGELWARVSDQRAVFLVAGPEGRIVASLGGSPVVEPGSRWSVVRAAQAKFPDQASGFLVEKGRLFQIVVTPVYVGSPRGPVLLNVLVAGYEIGGVVTQELKHSTGGSEFLFLSGGQALASTLNARATEEIVRRAAARESGGRISDGVIEYAPLVTPLAGIDGSPVGELWILRSFEGAAQRIAALRRDIIVIWLLSVLAGLGLTYLLARRIVEPVKQLDQAATEVARQNYEYRVKVESEDELGRLARTFNHMCASIQAARDELVHQERIATIGRLTSSIVHDLRNPLAAIYGGAEMLVDSELPPPQMKRISASIYRASRKIQELLQDLLNVSRGKAAAPEMCRLAEVVEAAREFSAAAAESQGVRICLEVPPDLELPMDRARVERVFANLIGNALEAMPEGGSIRIAARAENGWAVVEVADTGPGIPPEIRDRLFQPFVSAGKKNGLGLGLALSRQTILDHGGDMWVEPPSGTGADFRIRLPRRRA